MRANTKTSLILSAAIAALALLAAAPAEAADEHLFDPVLSLEGDCNGEDGVIDPSCTGEPPAYPAGNAPKAFNQPCGTSTDLHGNVYVANPALKADGVNYGIGEVDIFDPQGKFLTKIPIDHGPCQLAVDSEGIIYVVEEQLQEAGGNTVYIIDRYEPDSYPPTEATEYTLGAQFEFLNQEPGEVAVRCARPESLAVDPSNDHLYVGKSLCYVEEYGSAAEGTPLNPLIECCIGEAALDLPGPIGGHQIDVYGVTHDVYVTGGTNVAGEATNWVFIIDGTTGETTCKLEGSGVGPHPSFSSPVLVAIDQSNGDLYAFDSGNAAVEQFGPSGDGCPQFIGELPATPKPLSFQSPHLDIAVDAPLVKGEVGYDSPNEGYVYFTSGSTVASSHLWAFEPKVGAPPAVRKQSIDAATATEALLKAELSPNGLETTYHFEYTTQTAFEEVGYAGATSVPVLDKSAGAGGAFVVVSATASGLQPDTAYRFRLVASNCEAVEAEPGNCLTKGEGDPGGEGEDASFATYPLGETGLADGRAYELVTPPDTHGHIPTMGMFAEVFGFVGFASTMASPDGNSLVFGSNTGSLPGIGGGGSQDTFEALRDPSKGWQSHFTGLSGAQAEKPGIGGTSPDHLYGFWKVEGDNGRLALGGSQPTYIRVPEDAPEASANCAPATEPEGRFEWIGCGSLGFEPEAFGRWISPGGGHVIFVTTTASGGTVLQLEPCAPPTGEGAIYDRTPGGPTHCVSLLPGDVTPTDDAEYKGVSADGSAVAFTIRGDDNLYVRRDNAETLVVAGGDPTFGGLSRDGSRAFYTTGSIFGGGDIFSCDLDAGGCAGEGAHQPIQIGSGGESTLVNVSADGSHAYFVSKAVLTGEEENGHGANAQPGKENLYVWDDEGVRFIATVSSLDVEGEGAFAVGLGMWLSKVLNTSPTYSTGPADDPSRSTPDGSVLVFQSHEDLTGYESGGHSQVFRYDAEAEADARLSCLSCGPAGVPAESDAQLQTEVRGGGELFALPPLSPLMLIANVTADGQKAFFQSADRLVPNDVDGLQDVYEWRAQGASGCERQGGCLSLVSSGKSSEDDYLYAMTPNGSDVFFASADSLVAQDPGNTYSIYDARAGGGFPPPPPPPGDCLGEACQPVVAAPDDQTPATSSHVGPGNPKQGSKQPRRCPKGKRKTRRAGETRCVKRQSKKQSHKRHDNRRAQR